MKLIIPSTIITYRLLSRHLKPSLESLLSQYSTHYTTLPIEQKQRILSYFVSLVNAVLMTGLSGMHLHRQRKASSSSSKSNSFNTSSRRNTKRNQFFSLQKLMNTLPLGARNSSTPIRQMLSMELVYFADDLFSNFNILSVADILHHLCALLALLISVSTYQSKGNATAEKTHWIFERYFPRIMIAEASTIFLDLAFIMRALRIEGTLGSFLQKFCQLAFVALFFVIRVCFLPYVVYEMLKGGTIQRLGGKTGVMVSFIVIFLQLYWFVKIAHRFKREYLGVAEEKNGRRAALKARL